MFLWSLWCCCWYCSVVTTAQSQEHERAITSPPEMDVLDALEVQLLHILHSHVVALQQKISLLQERYKQLMDARPVHQDVADPVTTLTLVRRLVREWPLVLNIISERYEIPVDVRSLPGEEELRGVIRVLARLQDVYQLTTRELADNTSAAGSSMTANDCVEMGKYWYKEKDFLLASSWFDRALSKIVQGDTTARRSEILPFYYLSHTFSGCQYSKAMTLSQGLAQEILAESRRVPLSSELSRDFMTALSGNCSLVGTRRDLTSKSNQPHMTQEMSEWYSQLCQGRGSPVAAVAGVALRCHYVHHGNPRLLVAPFKLEELRVNPPVLMFHDVIYDNEIEHMKAAYDRVKEPCSIIDDKSEVFVTNTYRTCHVGWVDNSDETSARLSRRIADITDLDLTFAETNQVANYVVGGEFQLHYDAIKTAGVLDGGPAGDRLATLMFYLNDVASGGRTIFPYLHLAVTPRKGSALFWFNLDDKGDPLSGVMHGGCPILRGSKWVINKWIHEGGQDFQKTCPRDGQFPKKHYSLQGTTKSIKNL